MRIGIYNRYWNTRGGGERYAGVMAEILAQRYRLELLGPEPVDLTGLADHLGLDLSGSRFRLLPPVGERKLAPLTAEYDLFINCTYLSRLPSQAKRSVYLVLFPQSAWHPKVVHAARRVATYLSTERPGCAVPLDGFHEVDASGHRWSYERALVRVQPQAFRGSRARIRLIVPKGRSVAETLLDVQAPGITWSVQGDDLLIERPEPPGDAPVDLEIECRALTPRDLGLSNDTRRLGFCLANDRPFAPSARLRSLAERAGGRIDGHDREIPSRYDLLVAISEFTRTWVERRWGQPSEVLPPPVDTVTFSAPDPTEKRKVILSVGRFFHGSHNKKHLEMLRVFRRMVDHGNVPGGWEYHLAGNLHRNRLEDLEYFAELERLAEGYPVKLLIDLSLDRLIEEYRQASIFWHAAGWGENEEKQPEKFEHFGLTTCEAMSAGCVPVVIAKAGQLEIVEHGETGFLFSNARELEEITRRLMTGNGEPWVCEMRTRAAAAIQRFGRPRFEERLLEIFREHDLLT